MPDEPKATRRSSAAAAAAAAAKRDQEVRAEQQEALGALEAQVEHITSLKAEAEQQAQLLREELRLLNEEHTTAEAAAAHENEMLRLELTRSASLWPSPVLSSGPLNAAGPTSCS